MENDYSIRKYGYEVMSIEYESASGKTHIYVPDFVVYFKDGRQEIHEVKSLWKLKHQVTRIKTKIAEGLVEESDEFSAYKIISEEDIFNRNNII